MVFLEESNHLVAEEDETQMHFIIVFCRAGLSQQARPVNLSQLGCAIHEKIHRVQKWSL